MRLKRNLAMGMIAAICVLALPFSAAAQNNIVGGLVDQQITPPGTRTSPLTGPTAGVTGPRQVQNAGNDRTRTDSTMVPPNGSGGTGPGFTFPGGGVTVPACSDPSATNFGRAGPCVYTTCGAKPADEVRNVGCPSGQTGERIEARSYASAPSPTCWVAGGWAEIINTCAATCSPVKPSNETRNVACPVGQIGSITETRMYSSAVYPTCWVPSAWNQTSNTCVSSCGPQPSAEFRQGACRVGQTGSIIESRSYVSAPHPTCWTAMSWQEASNTCVNACPSRPANETRTTACPAGQAGTIAESRSYVSAPAPTCWTAGTWQQVSNTCASDSICPSQPTVETRSVACPSGFSGQITEIRSYTSAPAPTCWTAGTWTQNSNTCVATCGRKPPSERRSLGCNTKGEAGSITEQRDYFSSAAPACWTAGSWYQVSNTCSTGFVDEPIFPPPGDDRF